jgi:hypothetical protein
MMHTAAPPPDFASSAGFFIYSGTSPEIAERIFSIVRVVCSIKLLLLF